MASESPDEPPPAGGFGGPGSPGAVRFARTPAPATPRGALRAIGLTFAVLAGVILLVGTLGVLLRLFVGKYLAGSKTAEAKNTLGQMAKDGVYAYERERLGGPTRMVCPSASLPVPRDVASIRAQKYQSTRADWTVDEARDAGFACLRFEMSQPQYYQYRYVATETSVAMTAHGDLNGDGRLSSTILRGAVHDGRLVFEPSIEEIDPEE